MPEPVKGRTPSLCDYAGCRAESVGTYPRNLRPSWRFCAEHGKQKHHPRDIDMRRFVLDEEAPDA